MDHDRPFPRLNLDFIGAIPNPGQWPAMPPSHRGSLTSLTVSLYCQLTERQGGKSRAHTEGRMRKPQVSYTGVKDKAQH